MAVREYATNGLRGCVSQQRSRQTGYLVGIYHGPQAGIDDDDGRAPWSTVCEEHGSVICHVSLSLARAHAGVPLEWCEPCRIERDGRQFSAYFDVADELDGGLTLDELYAGLVEDARAAANLLGLSWPPVLAEAEEYALARPLLRRAAR